MNNKKFKFIFQLYDTKNVENFEALVQLPPFPHICTALRG